MDVPFEMKFSFKDVGSKALGKTYPVMIKPNDLKIKLTDVELAKIDGEKLPCDLEESGNMLVNNENITVPDTLICNFLTTKKGFTGYYNMELDAEFSYIYLIVRQETFSILPKV